MFGVVSATYTDHGGAGGVPALSTTSQHQIRQKHQEVEFAVSQSGTNTATNTDGGPTPPDGRRAPRQPRRAATGSSSTARSTWPTSTRSRSASRTPPPVARAGSPLAAIEVRQDALDGPIVTTHNLVSTGGTGDLDEPDLPDLAVRHARAVPRVPGGHGRRDRRQPVQPQLGRVRRAPGSECPRRNREPTRHARGVAGSGAPPLRSTFGSSVAGDATRARRPYGPLIHGG